MDKRRDEIPDKALDRIYDTIDILFTIGKYEEVDSLLESVDIPESHTDELIGYLTATLPAADRLPYRNTFFEEVKAEIISRGESEENLFDGL